jgi:hypothetical protein
MAILIDFENLFATQLSFSMTRLLHGQEKLRKQKQQLLLRPNETFDNL